MNQLGQAYIHELSEVLRWCVVIICIVGLVIILLFPLLAVFVLVNLVLGVSDGHSDPVAFLAAIMVLIFWFPLVVAGVKSR